jgi:hypothetical protein
MDEIKRLVKSLIQTNAAVYQLLLDWIDANQDEGLRTSGVASKPINFPRAKQAITEAIDRVKVLTELVESIK